MLYLGIKCETFRPAALNEKVGELGSKVLTQIGH